MKNDKFYKCKGCGRSIRLREKPVTISHEAPLCPYYQKEIIDKMPPADRVDIEFIPPSKNPQ